MTKADYQKIQSLTRREREVLQVLCQGARNELIADRLGIAINTVKNHLKSCMFKLGVEDRWQLILRAWMTGVTPWPKELVRAVKAQMSQPKTRGKHAPRVLPVRPVRV